MKAFDSFDYIYRAIENLNRRLQELSTRERALQAWQAPTLINSWTNSGGGYADAGYWKDPWGVVHLRGRITGGAFPSDAFVLPADYRPLSGHSFTVPTGAVVDIEADGSVRPVSGSSYVALDGVSFRAEQ